MSTPHEQAIDTRRASLREAFDLCRRYAAPDEPLWSTRPAPEAWSVREILEHVTLTNHYLLILVDKLSQRCRKRLARGDQPPTKASDVTALERISQREFAWPHPEHMTPSGTLAPEDLDRQLCADRDRCLALLDEFPGGGGALHTIRMSVVDARLDLYQFLAVIDLHARRHLRQLEHNRASLGPPA